MFYYLKRHLFLINKKKKEKKKNEKTIQLIIEHLLHELLLIRTHTCSRLQHYKIPQICDSRREWQQIVENGASKDADVVLLSNHLGLGTIFDRQTFSVVRPLMFSPIAHVSTCLPLVPCIPPLHMWYISYTTRTHKKENSYLLDIQSKNGSTILNTLVICENCNVNFLVILKKYSFSCDLKMHFLGFSSIKKEEEAIFLKIQSQTALFCFCFHLKITHFLHEIVCQMSSKWTITYKLKLLKQMLAYQDQSNNR